MVLLRVLVLWLSLSLRVFIFLWPLFCYCGWRCCWCVMVVWCVILFVLRRPFILFWRLLIFIFLFKIFHCYHSFIWFVVTKLLIISWLIYNHYGFIIYIFLFIYIYLFFLFLYSYRFIIFVCARYLLNSFKLIFMII